MMHLYVTNLKKFFEIVNACESPVRMIVAEHEPEELRDNQFVQKLLLDTQNGVTKLSVEINSAKDATRLIRFMMEDGAAGSEPKGTSRIHAA